MRRAVKPEIAVIDAFDLQTAGAGGSKVEPETIQPVTSFGCATPPNPEDANVPWLKSPLRI